MQQQLRPKKYFSRYNEPILGLPNLVEAQVKSYQWFLKNGLTNVLKEFSSMEDYSGKKFKLTFESFELGMPQYDEFYAKENKLTYEAPLRARVKLHNKGLKIDKEQEIFLADVPLMTAHGTFIVNGNERVIVAQLVRSTGVYFTDSITRGARHFGAKVIPARGVWIEIEQESDGMLYVRIDKKRKFFASSFLRIFAEGRNDEQITDLFKDNPVAQKAVSEMFAKDPAKNISDSHVEIYKRLRDGTMGTPDHAKEFIEGLFAEEKYDLSLVGRHRFNRQFEKDMGEKAMSRRSLSIDDIVTIIIHLSTLSRTPGAAGDDIDHLGVRRVQFVGETLQQRIRVGMTRMRRNIQDKMSTVEPDTTLPVTLLNPRPLQTIIKEFFNTNALSQYMGQKNILDEVEHVRTLSALGPGGLTRERAGFEVRDVHPSHYGRVCPIHTPEGRSIGLVLHLSLYASINDFGMIETPYVKVKKGRVTGEIVYLNALEEEKYKIAHAAVRLDENKKIIDTMVQVRVKSSLGEAQLVAADEVDFMDVSPEQPFSVATSLIPFLDSDDANRALMGSNMQKQAVPCVRAQAPLVATGIEASAAKDSGRVIFSDVEGVVSAIDARHCVVKDKNGKTKEHALNTFQRTNGSTVFHQRASVSVGDKVKKGSVLADCASTVGGELALGQNLLVAFLSWGGSNYEDAIVLSERLVRDSVLTSIHMEEFEINVRETKLGPEITTHDIPNVGDAKLRNLDEEGIVRVGAEVGPNDILVGKITPKGESELTPEERLLRSIFGEKARDVKDTSKRMEHGKRGRIVGVRVFSREKGDNLEAGILKRIYIDVAQLRNISVGDKLAGRHGNKGVISKILPVEEMPFLPDGTPVDVVLTPLGVPSRMNLGQIFELHLGRAAYTLGYQAVVPPFLGATESEVREELKKSGWQENGKTRLHDGRTGDSFAQDVSVGYMYIIKLEHMVEDKIHMRSIGPYSLIHQQPLGGKAQGGGQRFGEMEVWALEGYGAAATLQEMITIKSDDIFGRSAAFDAIVRQEPIKQPNLPESFKVMLHYLRALSLNIELIGGSGVPEMAMPVETSTRESSPKHAAQKETEILSS